MPWSIIWGMQSSSAPNPQAHMPVHCLRLMAMVASINGWMSGYVAGHRLAHVTASPRPRPLWTGMEHLLFAESGPELLRSPAGFSDTSPLALFGPCGSLRCCGSPRLRALWGGTEHLVVAESGPVELRGSPPVGFSSSESPPDCFVPLPRRSWMPPKATKILCGRLTCHAEQIWWRSSLDIFRCAWAFQWIPSARRSPICRRIS